MRTENGKKVHYKLHKVKKQWVTIAVTSAALASIVGGATVANQKVSADETTQPVASTTAESDVVVETHEVAAPAATATTDATAVTTDKAADTITVETPAAASTAADTSANTAVPATTDRAAVVNDATTEAPANSIVFNIVNTTENPAQSLKAYSETNGLDYETLTFKCIVKQEPDTKNDKILKKLTKNSCKK